MPNCILALYLLMVSGPQRGGLRAQLLIQPLYIGCPFNVLLNVYIKLQPIAGLQQQGFPHLGIGVHLPKHGVTQG
jgi:hypothetical protein